MSDPTENTTKSAGNTAKTAGRGCNPFENEYRLSVTTRKVHLESNECWKSRPFKGDQAYKDWGKK